MPTLLTEETSFRANDLYELSVLLYKTGKNPRRSPPVGTTSEELSFVPPLHALYSIT